MLWGLFLDLCSFSVIVICYWAICHAISTLVGITIVFCIIIFLLFLLREFFDRRNWLPVRYIFSILRCFFFVNFFLYSWNYQGLAWLHFPRLIHCLRLTHFTLFITHFALWFLVWSTSSHIHVRQIFVTLGGSWLLRQPRRLLWLRWVLSGCSNVIRAMVWQEKSLLSIVFSFLGALDAFGSFLISFTLLTFLKVLTIVYKQLRTVQYPGSWGPNRWILFIYCFSMSTFYLKWRVFEIGTCICLPICIFFNLHRIVLIWPIRLRYPVLRLFMNYLLIIWLNIEWILVILLLWRHYRRF